MSLASREIASFAATDRIAAYSGSYSRRRSSRTVAGRTLRRQPGGDVGKQVRHDFQRLIQQIRERISDRRVIQVKCSAQGCGLLAGQERQPVQQPTRAVRVGAGQTRHRLAGQASIPPCADTSAGAWTRTPCASLPREVLRSPRGPQARAKIILADGPSGVTSMTSPVPSPSAAAPAACGYAASNLISAVALPTVSV
jgi:hypothetical protein